MTDFDVRKSLDALQDLEETPRAESPLVRLDADDRPGPPLRVVANRAGLFRLGLRLAAASLRAEGRVLVHGDGTVRENGEAGVIEVFLTDNPVLSQRQPGRRLRWLFASLILCVTGLAVFGLATLLTMFSNR